MFTNVAEFQILWPFETSLYFNISVEKDSVQSTHQESWVVCLPCAARRRRFELVSCQHYQIPLFHTKKTKTIIYSSFQTPIWNYWIILKHSVSMQVRLSTVVTLINRSNNLFKSPLVSFPTASSISLLWA